jgi:putative drug exporter of the RND superfamily
MPISGFRTNPAVVMISVFAVFATLSLLIFKELGVGLAVAVLIDATIIRAVLLPATMKLLGDWNWYLPGWLEWLPHIGPGGEPELPPDREEPGAVEAPERLPRPAPESAPGH